MFALLILIIQLVHSFNFDHPEVPTLFIWRIDESCLSTCKLNVTSKKTNETVDFIPNIRYFHVIIWMIINGISIVIMIDFVVIRKKQRAFLNILKRFSMQQKLSKKRQNISLVY